MQRDREVVRYDQHCVVVNAVRVKLVTDLAL